MTEGGFSEYFLGKLSWEMTDKREELNKRFLWGNIK
jgi:hypothetical protein